MTNSTEVREAIESYVKKNCHSFPSTLWIAVVTKTVKGENTYKISAFDRGFEDARFAFKFNQNTFKRQLKKYNDQYLCESAMRLINC